MKAAILYYDGDCGICTALANFAYRKSGGKLRIIPISTVDNPEELLNVGEEEFQKSVWLIRDDRIFRRSEAVFRCMQLMQMPWKIFGTLLSIPPLPFIFNPVYNFIARHRHYISYLSGMKSCGR